MKVVVTGGAGYIGSHAAKALRDQGYEPVVIDNLERGHEWAVQFGPLVKLDIRQTGLLAKALAEIKPVAVMHFAALALVAESVEKPELYYDNNVGGTLSLLNAMNSAGVKNLIFSSTCATYQPHEKPFTESDLQQPVNPYGASKLMAEQVIRDFSLAHEMNYQFLRYFNVAGSDSEGLIGEAHEPETHIIPLLLQTAAGKRDAFTLFGSDYPTPDGTCVRDYIHVEDLITAHFLAMKRSLDGGTSEAFNLSLNQGYSNKQVVESVRKRAGVEFPVQMGDRRPGDPAQLIGDSAKARELLSWKPEHDLDSMIDSAWKWFQSYQIGS
ncbi:MAG: UDP-glucose 4-epimerase GalE [Pseudomonadota bacterium]